MGCCLVIAQIVRANKNAKRLHGAPSKFRQHVQSQLSHMVSHTMPRKNAKSKKAKKNANKNNSSKRGRVTTVIKEVHRPMSIGAQIGHGLQQAAISVFKRITGQGDYKLSNNIGSVKSNSMMNKFRSQPPTFGSQNSSFVFEHCEFIGDVSGSSGFEAQSFTINPTNPATFPWLSTLANSFESYEIEGMLVRFESTSGNATGSNTALGTVMCYIAYDPVDPVPANKSTLLQYEGVVDAKPSESFLVGVECDPQRLVMKRLYMGTPGTNEDPRFYNFGNIILANQGQQSTNIVGELWLHYRIRCYVARDPSNLPGPPLQLTTFGSLIVLTPTSTPFSNAVILNQSALRVSFTNSTVSWLAEPGLLYIVQIQYTGTTASLTIPNFTYTNCALVDYPVTTGINDFTSGYGFSASSGTYQLCIQANSTIPTYSPIALGTNGGSFPTSAQMSGFVALLG